MIQIILPVFILIIAGFIIGRYKKLDIGPLVWLIVYITGPSLLFSALVKSSIQLEEFMSITIASASIVLSMLAIVMIMLKFILKRKLSGIALPMVFGNTGYIGFPIALLAFGSEGLVRAVIYSNIESIFMFSIGIFILSHKKGFSEMFRLPFLYVIFLGILTSVLSISIPSFLLEPVDMLGMSTIPLALLVLGYRLTQIRVRETFIPALMSFFKIGVGLAVAFAVVAIFPMSDISRKVVILLASMPSAVFTMILCERYNSDSMPVASAIFVSTAMSIITIPLVLWIIS